MWSSLWGNLSEEAFCAALPRTTQPLCATVRVQTGCVRNPPSSFFSLSLLWFGLGVDLAEQFTGQGARTQPLSLRRLEFQASLKPLQVTSGIFRPPGERLGCAQDVLGVCGSREGRLLKGCGVLEL